MAKPVTDATDSMNVVTTKTLYINSYELLPPLGTVGGQVLAEYVKIGTGNVTLARTYTCGEYVDEPLTLTDYTDLGSVSAGDPELFYYHHNRVYHVIGLTDESDDIVELYAYTPYGQVETLAPSLNPRSESAYGNRYLFTGRYLDHETGMFYFRARYFDAELGRFVGRDPLNYEVGLLLYAAYFVPNGIDPSGLAREELTLGVGLYLGVYGFSVQYTETTEDCCVNGVPGTRLVSRLRIRGELSLGYNIQAITWFGVAGLRANLGSVHISAGQRCESECVPFPRWPRRPCCRICAPVGITVGPSFSIGVGIANVHVHGNVTLDGRVCYNGGNCPQPGFSFGICGSWNFTASYSLFGRRRVAGSSGTRCIGDGNRLAF